MTWVEDKLQADEVALIEATQGVGVVDFHQTCPGPCHVETDAVDKAVERYVVEAPYNPRLVAEVRTSASKAVKMMDYGARHVAKVTALLAQHVVAPAQ